MDVDVLKSVKRGFVKKENECRDIWGRDEQTNSRLRMCPQYPG